MTRSSPGWSARDPDVIVVWGTELAQSSRAGDLDDPARVSRSAIVLVEMGLVVDLARPG